MCMGGASQQMQAAAGVDGAQRRPLPLPLTTRPTRGILSITTSSQGRAHHYAIWDSHLSLDWRIDGTLFGLRQLTDRLSFRHSGLGYDHAFSLLRSSVQQPNRTSSEMKSYTLTVDVPAGTKAYFIVSDAVGDASGFTDTFTVLSSGTSRPPTLAGTSNASSALTPAPTPVVHATQGSTNVGAIADGAVGGISVVLLLGLCWWQVKRRTGTGENQTATASPTFSKASAQTKTPAPPSGTSDATCVYGFSRPQGAGTLVHELAYNQKTPTSKMVATNSTPDQIRHEVEPPVEEQGRTSVQSTAGSTASPFREQELEQCLRALETRITSIDAPPSYDDES
ncbi:hypothetical protein B0H19DRAFT_1274769 [Mycena capillaripes]|nr:hypothetical protein B0H19DRAFT_1274769 [Mycena capillaripes]